MNKNKNQTAAGEGKITPLRVHITGNPNVGKSTVFNALTGLRQHTGNWPGKTVETAQGSFFYKGRLIQVTDLPGTYSLLSHSQEEEIARDALLFSPPDVTLLVADATCLERSLGLFFQVGELTNRLVLCVNLQDEARKKGIQVDCQKLSKMLGVRVVGVSARSGQGLTALKEALLLTAAETPAPQKVYCSGRVEEAAARLQKGLYGLGGLARWAALRVLENEPAVLASLANKPLFAPLFTPDMLALAQEARVALLAQGYPQARLQEEIASAYVRACEMAASQAVSISNTQYLLRDKKIDILLTSRWLGMPIMLCLLFLVLWITLEGANYPSQLLSKGLFSLLGPLRAFFAGLQAPAWVTGLLVEGAYKTLAWVTAVMLPPMAIFFPLFTLLEDLGYLPRMAFNLDSLFRKAGAHGKQALTMCMGLGCNACGVVGCRIIDSPRERLIAILTNTFMPCNGRFPTLVALCILLFAGQAGYAPAQALFLSGVIVFCVGVTLAISRLLSKTLLKGQPSGFQLVLPPYRRPQIGRVLVRSLLDRTLFVLGRAAAVAAPAGAFIWALANIQAGGQSLLAHCAGFLQPMGNFIGMDGFILLAFLLALPANELFLPLLLLCYTAAGSLAPPQSMAEFYALLSAHGWTWLTVSCVLLFTLLHWPCATTLLSIRRETRSIKWCLLSFALPTFLGLSACALLAAIVRM